MGFTDPDIVTSYYHHPEDAATPKPRALEGMVWPAMRIYIAGPYTASSPLEVESNVNRAIDAGIAIIAKGHSPFIPHLSHFVEIRNEKAAYMHGIRLTYETYMLMDHAWLELCDALFLLGHSPGADRELAWAQSHGLTIYRDWASIPTAGSLVGDARRA